MTLIHFLLLLRKRTPEAWVPSPGMETAPHLVLGLTQVRGEGGKVQDEGETGVSSRPDTGHWVSLSTFSMKYFLSSETLKVSWAPYLNVNSECFRETFLKYKRGFSSSGSPYVWQRKRKARTPEREKQGQDFYNRNANTHSRHTNTWLGALQESSTIWKPGFSKAKEFSTCPMAFGLVWFDVCLF